MGLIRGEQTNFLREGKEQINYKRFSYDGTYVETVDEDVLIHCPDDLIPLDRNLIKLYEKPLKEVHFVSEPLVNYYVNENAQFLNGSEGWIITPASLAYINQIADDVIFLQDNRPKALSGSKYFRTTNNWQNVGERKMLTTDHQITKVKVNQEMNFAFDVYFLGDVADASWIQEYTLTVQEVYNSDITVGGKTFDFTNNEWGTSYTFDFGRSSSFKRNIWNKVSISIPPYIPTSDAVTEVFVSFSLRSPYSTNLVYGESVYYDNVRMSETIDFDGGISSIRKQYDYNGTFTGVYKSEGNIFSNELADNENYIGKFSGGFKRPRDSQNKTVEQIVTIEILNDNRDYLTKYEGTFKNKGDYNVSPHKKVWVDFGDDVLQEPVSCYIDSLKFNVKAAIYDIKMHVPNQDDDVESSYQVTIE